MSAAVHTRPPPRTKNPPTRSRPAPRSRRRRSSTLCPVRRPNPGRRRRTDSRTHRGGGSSSRTPSGASTRWGPRAVCAARLPPLPPQSPATHSDRRCRCRAPSPVLRGGGPGCSPYAGGRARGGGELRAPPFSFLAGGGPLAASCFSSYVRDGQTYSPDSPVWSPLSALLHSARSNLPGRCGALEPEPHQGAAADAPVCFRPRALTAGRLPPPPPTRRRRHRTPPPARLAVPLSRLWRPALPAATHPRSPRRLRRRRRRRRRPRSGG